VSTGTRRLALQCRVLARAVGRPALLVCGLRPGAGVSSVVEAAGAGLRREQTTVTTLSAQVLEVAPPPLAAEVVLVDGGPLLPGGGPLLDAAWRPLIAGVVLVVVADEDRLADLDEARALLQVLELPTLAVVFNERTRVPLGVLLKRAWQALRRRLPRRARRADDAMVTVGVRR
jgi:hypothetical protein